MGETPTRGLADLTVAGFTELLASKEPLPGGGSAAALVGALGAALAGMVGRLTVGRPRYAEHEGRMTESIHAADAQRAELLGLMEADMRAYQAVIAAYQLPKGSEAQASCRTQAIQEALRAATEAPLETAAHCLEALELAATAAAHGNRNATSDAIVGALLAHAGLQAAAHSLYTNLALIHDAEFGAQARRRAGAIETAGAAALARALAATQTGA